MPTYEFRCPEGHEFEKFYRSIGSAESVVACPTCGKTAERMMSATGFAFKGSGFYLTDYGKNAHRGDASPGAKAAHSTPSESGGESAKSESSGGTESKTDGAKASGEPAKAESKKADAKPAESKPASPAPKPSSSE